MRDIEFEEAMEYACMKVQEYTDKIQAVVNPIPGNDIPFLYNSLQSFIDVLESLMDAEQKEFAKKLSCLMSTSRTITTAPCGTFRRMMKEDKE